MERFCVGFEFFNYFLLFSPLLISVLVFFFFFFFISSLFLSFLLLLYCLYSSIVVKVVVPFVDVVRTFLMVKVRVGVDGLIFFCRESFWVEQVQVYQYIKQSWKLLLQYLVEISIQIIIYLDSFQLVYWDALQLLFFFSHFSGWSRVQKWVRW